MIEDLTPDSGAQVAADQPAVESYAVPTEAPKVAPLTDAVAPASPAVTAPNTPTGPATDGPSPKVPSIASAGDSSATSQGVGTRTDTPATDAAGVATADPAQTPSAVDPATAESSPPQPSADSGTTADDASTGKPSLSPKFVGLDSEPISAMTYRFEAGGEVVHGTTDADGCAPIIASLPAGLDCSVFVKKDDGAFKQIATFTIPSRDATVTLVSPSMLLKGQTQLHGGSPDDAHSEAPGTPPITSDDGHPAYKPAQAASAPASAPAGTSKSAPAHPAASHSSAQAQAPHASTKGGEGKKAAQKTVATSRDSLGHPVAKPAEDMTDWAGRKIHAAWHYVENLFGISPNPLIAKSALTPAATASVKPQGTAAPAGAHSLDQLKTLIDIAEGQTLFEMPFGSTQANINAIAAGTVKYGSKGAKDSKGRCYMYVKIALWRANIVHFLRNSHNELTASGGEYAKVAGTFLLSQGFQDVTHELPDPRWALPGDVIVYRVVGDTETEDKKGLAGHVDIRTYHYYISDLKRNYLCMRGYKPKLHFYEPIGIYRKPGLSDPMALARTKAFLKIIRSREAKTFFQLGGDAATYRAAGHVYDLSKGNKDLSTFPAGAKYQGAYQISRENWTDGQRPEQGALPNDFSPQTQDRYAVYLMERRPGRFGADKQACPTALGYVRCGDLDNAVRILRPEWACLPGQSQDQGYTMAELKSDFEKYVKEYS